MPISLDNGFLDNDSEFSSLHEYNYPKKLELKLEYQGEHTTFLDLDITAEENIFVYKLFEKFPFFIVRMSYLSSNISSSILYG